MSDLTIHAESLISTVARAFYDDDSILLVDVLIAQKYLRDDDMAQRLSLPARKLRATLQFLQEENLVRSETVDDLAQGGSQASKFYYLDYNRAVHSIRLRLLLLRQKLEKSELEARSNSYYLCPGYKTKRCNGRYTEEDAQQVVDQEEGLFLCQECSRNFQHDPMPVKEYTLQLVDNTKDLRIAVDNLRRLNVQLSAKFVDGEKMRAGIYDLLQSVRGKGKKPITSNLPSENFSVGVGSRRLEGTGRTAGIKAKKLEQQGVAASAEQARKYLVGHQDADLLFLKNALGHEVRFAVERGGGDRARFLASKKLRRHKLMDAAASRVGSALPLHISLEENRKRKAEEEAKKEEKTSEHGRKLMKAGDTFFFLRDNIGRKGGVNGDSHADSKPKATMKKSPKEQEEPEEEADDGLMADPSVVLVDDVEELRRIPEDLRVKTFQTEYKIEIDRQIQMLQSQGVDPLASPRHSLMSSEDEDVMWEDGE